MPTNQVQSELILVSLATRPDVLSLALLSFEATSSELPGGHKDEKPKLREVKAKDERSQTERQRQSPALMPP